MSRQLWLLRHGDAEPHGSRPDPERRLTPRGEEQSRLAGEALRQLGLEFTVVLTSPKVRAHQTAALAGEALGMEPVIHDEVLGLDGREARTIVAGFGPDERVLLVGHEPDFSNTVHDLCGGALIDMKKGGIAAVRLGSAGGDLMALLRPRELAAIAAASGSAETAP